MLDRPQKTLRQAEGGEPGPLSLDTWVFDLDNTLYPASSGLFVQVNRRIRAFISSRLEIGDDEAAELQGKYFRRYRSSLRGLMLDHGVEPAAFLEYVHDIDLSPIGPNDTLRNAVAALPGRKVIFTNGSVDHAQRVLARLGLDGLFEAIFDIHAADYLPKPEPRTYHRLLEVMGIEAQRSALLEDLAMNLEPAAALGMTTVWVRDPQVEDDGGKTPDYVDHEVTDLVAWLRGIVG